MGASPWFLLPPDKKTSAAELPDRMPIVSPPELHGLLFVEPEVGSVSLRSLGLSLVGRKLFGLRPQRCEEGGRWLFWLSLAGRSRKLLTCSPNLLLCTACGWMSSSRGASCSRRTFFSARTVSSSSSIVALTLLAVLPFGKSPTDLGCYGMFWMPSLFPEDGACLASNSHPDTYRLDISSAS